ncbi:MAG TPA: type IV secretion system DNA-binding domain-containing protein, partial [Patescibacteria group bacterium]|nr:type IV secretion system DNA-binding domain-containing protein [Patescibacteria group bacterium]
MPFTAQPYDHDHENEVTLFGETNFRNQKRKFGIKTDDRRRHMYVVGKTGMGKTTLLENMVLSDIHAGHGLAYIDPHGDTAKTLLDFIPPHRINDVVYVNPADMDFPIGFNILEVADESQKHLVAAGLMGVFKKIWPDVWSSRMEYILLNTIMALLDFPGSTLLGINRLLSDEEYRKRVVSLIQDPVVKTFWVKEFASFSEKYRTEAIAPIQNKVGQFLSASIIRNIVAQVKSTINIREIMDTRKIFIVNLSKGLIGEENSRLLGAMIITRLQLAAMERVDMPEKDRQDFYLYVDEFQNFATESFANILSEARKYRLALIVAHQYIEQLEEEVRDAVFGNVGTLIAFRVGAADAAYMENEFMPRFTPEDLVNLTKFQIYLKLMIDGASSEPFSANTLAPIAQRTNSTEKVVKVSRERYASKRSTVEEKVIRWAGFGTGDTGQQLLAEDEEAQSLAERIKELEATSPDVGEMAEPAGGGGFGGPKKKKPVLYQVPCAVCGKPQDLTFEPDWSKPWLCKEHLEAKQAGTLPKGVRLTPAGAGPGAPPEVQERFKSAPAPRRDDRPRQSPPPPPRAEAKPLAPPADAKPVSLAALQPRAERPAEERPRRQDDRKQQPQPQARRDQKPQGGDRPPRQDNRGNDRNRQQPPRPPRVPPPAAVHTDGAPPLPTTSHKPRIVISGGV